MRPNLQHAIERVGRPGGSHEDVGRKKALQTNILSHWIRLPMDVFTLPLLQEKDTAVDELTAQPLYNCRTPRV